jgi:signal transduction histidine kinase
LWCSEKDLDDRASLDSSGAPEIARRNRSPLHEVSMRKPLYFRPAARLQVVLSEELVADPNVAVLEFVKNAYDAEAGMVQVRFELGLHPKDSRVIIADDGTGMDLDGIERNFMRPGYSEKAGAAPPEGKRIPVGEKGLGRLAAGRLGERFDVYTRPDASEPWLHLGFDWDEFDDMQQSLDEVPVYVDTETEPPEVVSNVGTVVVITGLRRRWDSRVPGRKVKGRATTRLGRLRQDLELLLLPLRAAGPGFEIDLSHNSSLPEDEEGSGRIEAPELRLLDYEFDFALERDGDDWSILRTIRRSPDLVSRLSLEPEEDIVVTLEEVGLGTLDPTLVGSFDGSVYYAPESAQQLEQIRAPIGVRLYRDGVRVDPYGDPGDDWLGVNAYRASRQGHAAIQPKALYGSVRISRRDNRELRPLANREGLLDNDALEAFQQVCREELRWFGSLIEKEYSEPAKEQRREDREGREREAAAVNVQRYAVAVTRAAVHAVRQPVAGAGLELHRMQTAIADPAVPDELRKRLQALYDSTREHLAQIDTAVERLTRFLEFDPTARVIDVRDVVEDVLDRAKAAAASNGVTLRTTLPDAPVSLEVAEGLLDRALEELVDNAIQAPRRDDSLGIVTVSVAPEDRLVRISVDDTGTGVPEAIRERLFKESVSTTGHIGLGLLFNRQLLALARGDLALVKSDDNGSRFEITLPV